MKVPRLKSMCLIGLRSLVLTCAILWIYTPVLNGEFLWDDISLITNNWMIQAGSLDSLAAIWVEPDGADYFPLTYSVLWLEWITFGSDPFGYHLINVLFHLSSCFLIWIALNHLNIPGAWISAFVFGTHPVCVESVAWISEVKNTLSLPLFLLTCFFWIKHEELSSKKLVNRYYVLALMMFTAAMLAKPVMVATPFLTILYAWWKRGVVSHRTFYQSVPLFLIAFVLGLITLSFQWERGIGDYVLPIGGIASRFAVAGMAVAFYLFKVFWPFDLMPMYPQWSIQPLYFWQFLPWLGIFTIGSFMWMNRRGWGQHALFAVGFFLLMVSPVLGFLDFSFMFISWVSDHFLYVPMIGLIVGTLAAWETFFRSQQRPIQFVGKALILCVICVNVLMSHSYAEHWRSAKALWTYTLSKNDTAWQAHLAIGGMEFEEGKVHSALEHLERAGELKPDDFRVQLGLATALLDNGNPQRAADILERITQIYSSNTRLMEVLVTSWVQSGQFTKAIRVTGEMLEANPARSSMRLQRARALQKNGDIDLAKEEYGVLLEIDKENREAQEGLAEALLLEKKHN